jgi:NADP-dependent 3-hydroxy acid dehydrogenase YdfG
MICEDRVIVITGASSGIGAATARLLGRRGFRAVLAARRADRLEALAEEIRACGGEALPVATDVTQLHQIQDLVGSAIAEYGRIDLLFNNAGWGRSKALEALDPEAEIDLQLRVNLSGVIQTTRAVLPHMIERRRGHIINMSSIAGLVGTPTFSVYSASKAGVRGFSEALRREARRHGIFVSTIQSGAAATEFAEHSGVPGKIGIGTPKRLALTAEDVARTVLRVIDHPRRSVIIPAPMRLLVWANSLFPGLVDWVVERRSGDLERQK